MSAVMVSSSVCVTSPTWRCSRPWRRDVMLQEPPHVVGREVHHRHHPEAVHRAHHARAHHARDAVHAAAHHAGPIMPGIIGMPGHHGCCGLAHHAGHLAPSSLWPAGVHHARPSIHGHEAHPAGHHARPIGDVGPSSCAGMCAASIPPSSGHVITGPLMHHGGHTHHAGPIHRAAGHHPRLHRCPARAGACAGGADHARSGQRALPITETEDRLMAAAAMIGLSSSR